MISFFVLLLAGAPLEPISTRDGVLPVQVVDSADGICHYGMRNHIELVAVETGKTKVTTASWSRILGELPDGALLVTNERVPKVKQVRVAVLERATGAERYSCGIAVDPNALDFTWMKRNGGLRAEVYRTFEPSGVVGPPRTEDELKMFALGATFSAKACSLTHTALIEKNPSYTLLPLSYPPAVRMVVGDEYVELEYLKDGKPLWRRHATFSPVACLLP